MMKIQIPEITFQLPEWNDFQFSPVLKAVEKLERVATRAGKTSPRFQQACAELRRLSRTGLEDVIHEAIKDNLYVRALTYLLSAEKDFFSRVPITEELLESLHRPRRRLSRVSLLQLISAYLLYFDEIEEYGDLKKTCEFLRSELQSHEGDSSSDLGRLAENRKVIFDIEGPSNIVQLAKVRETDLDEVFRLTGIGLFSKGRFLQVCRYRYYLETLKEILPGSDHPVLTEVCKPEVFNAPAGEDRLLGHEILCILIDRTTGELSEAWQKVILTIAGDPRVPQGHRRFQRWWALIGEERIKKVRGWLSRFDLLLFLDILEEYGRSSGNSELQRMFPARKRFLEGLYRQGLINETRLFVSSQAEKYLRMRYKSHEIPEYARVKDPYRSVIYLQVGNCHVTEGSHSFKFWVFPQLPESTEILDYNIDVFTPGSLGMDLERAYQREFGYQGEQPAGVRHHPPLGWQAEAIKHLKKYVGHLDVEDLFSRSDYRDYLWKYGL